MPHASSKKTLIALLVATLFLTGCDRFKAAYHSLLGSTPAAERVAPTADGRPGMLLVDFTKLVEQEGPAVVNIAANRVDNGDDNSDEEMPAIPVPEDDPLYDFFRRFMPNGPQQQQPRDAVSYGSGFILSADGYIMTNAHVVNGATQIQVKLTDRREFKAKLIGLDKRTDVALLKINADKLPAVNIGNPTTLKVGEWVAAIGAPFGFDNTVTAGIVSAKGRSLPDDSYVPFIQTDVAINPGNSGGPLFNLKGEVVGINSQIYSRSGGFMGISFSIPIDLAMSVAEQIKSTGKVVRGQIGVRIQELNADLARSFGRNDSDGALVVSIEPNSPAARADLQVGDIILALDGNRVVNSKDLPILVGQKKPGTTITLDIWRKGKQLSSRVVLGELQVDEPHSKSIPSTPAAKTNFATIGLQLSDIPAEKKSQLKISGGVVVETSTGLAAQAGLMPGDLILAINQNAVSNVKAFAEILKNSNGVQVALLVRRHKDTLYIPLRLKVATAP